MRLTATGPLHVVVGVGAVGRAVVNELTGRGLPVRAIARHPVGGLPPEVELVQADITVAATARLAMTGAAVIYHTASAPYHRWPALLPPLMRGVLDGAAPTGAGRQPDHCRRVVILADASAWETDFELTSSAARLLIVI